MSLYLVRHGQTEWNAAGRFQSHTDVPLNATGLAQAQRLRELLAQRGVRFSAAWSSPLSRAVNTALLILAGSGVELVVEPSFIEVWFGDYEGRYETELRATYGEAYQQWRDAQYTLSPPGGENIVGVAERVRPALKALLPSALHSDVLIVAHQAVLMAMKVALTGRSDIDSAAAFRQNNDEVDVWNAQTGERIERLRIE